MRAMIFAAAMNGAMTGVAGASEVVQTQAEGCWSAPRTVGADDTVTAVVEIDADGKPVSVSSQSSSEMTRAAERALNLCGPYPVTAGQYEVTLPGQSNRKG